jgi:hypothetical protein
VIPAALALHNSPRRYALLLGSGISRDTGILTAGEITDDLIRQIAGDKIQPGQKPQDWYKETHDGRAPTFTSLFSELAKSGEDRKAILRQYFELEGIEPTPAHMSIARLVKSGVISMIITTNFDTLLEEAIRKETGKTPVIITHESDPRLMEVAGDLCRIVMVNGRYPTTDLKLTPDDLASYDDNLVDYLNRIFSEYGLLICGWSGEHDTGLVKIFTADRIRRFAIFWCSRDAPDKIPEAIRSKVHLSTIGITSANEFFGDLESRIDLLRRHERTTSLTVESAVKKVKDAMRDPRPELVLSDFLHEETDRVLAELRIDVTPVDVVINKKDCFKNRLEDLERASAPLAAMVATMAYYDNGAHAELISETIDRLINFAGGPQVSGALQGTDFQDKLRQIQLYPALLVIYASGIAAVRKGNFNSLAAILEKNRARRFINMSFQDRPFHTEVNIRAVFGLVYDWLPEIYKEKFGEISTRWWAGTKPSDTSYIFTYPARIVQDILKSLIPSEITYEGSFDIFEYLFGLSYLNQAMEEPSQDSPPLSSRLWGQYVGFGGSGKIKFPDTLQSYLSDIGPKIERSVFFNGDPQQLLTIMWKHGKIFEITPPETGIVPDLPTQPKIPGTFH